MAIKWDDRFYRWDKTFSRQTGDNGEICIVVGAKNTGKTFGLRLQCIEDYLTRKVPFCEICRTKAERDSVKVGYFDKLQHDGFYTDFEFKVEKDTGYINIGTHEEPDWQLICYFVALSAFQQEKKRTFAKPYRFIFDEAIIDTKDRFHRYLKDEFLILANLLDTISRQQPGDDYRYRLFILGNACDLTAPYFRYLGIDTIPSFGYHWYRNKSVLLHYVEPWDAQERKEKTLVGRMLAGSDESSMVFDNLFEKSTGKGIMQKTPNAKYSYALVFNKQRFAVWIDYKRGLFFINDYIPKEAKNIYTLTKKDGRIDYNAVRKTDALMKILIETYYLGGLRYSSVFIRESFHEVLGFLGIK